MAHFDFGRSLARWFDSDFDNLLGLRTIIKRLRTVMLPDKVDLYPHSDPVKIILLGGMHHSGPSAFFPRIADHFEFGPVTHAAQVNFCDSSFDCVKRQVTRFDVLPPLIRAKHAVRRLDSEVLCSSCSFLNLVDLALILLEAVNDSQFIPRIAGC